MNDRYDEFRKRNRLKFIAAKFIFICICATLFTFIFTFLKPYIISETVAENIYFCSTDISGLTYDECTEYIKQSLKKIQQKKIVILYKEHTENIVANQYITHIEQAEHITERIRNDHSIFSSEKREYVPNIEIDRRKLRTVLTELSRKYDKNPQNAYIKEYAIFSRIEKSVSADIMNIDPVLKKIEHTMQHSLNTSISVYADTVTVNAEKKQSDFVSLYSLSTLVCKKDIDITLVSKEEQALFRTFIRRFDHVVLGTVFDFNIISNAENSELSSQSISRLLPGVFYYLCLQSGMSVVKRKHNKTFFNTQYPAGFDTSVDTEHSLTMRNTLFKRILIKIIENKNKYSVLFYASTLPYTYCKLDNSDIEIIPFAIKRIRNKELPRGEVRVMQKGINGLHVKVKRIIEYGQKKTEQIVSEDRYEPVEQVVLYN